MDIGLQIQGIKTFIDNMKLQVENIEMQNNNAMNPLMMNQIGDQLLNLSIQMLNNGIQYFNNFKYLSMNINQYIEKLKVISQQINNKRKKINVPFQHINGNSTNLVVQPDTTIKELIDKYMSQVYGYENKDLTFIFNGKRFDRNSQTTLRELFGIHLYANPKIVVNEKIIGYN